MTEDQIERMVERKFDALDSRYMRGELPKAAYEAESKAIDAWAEARYAERGASERSR